MASSDALDDRNVESFGRDSRVEVKDKLGEAFE